MTAADIVLRVRQSGGEFAIVGETHTLRGAKKLPKRLIAAVRANAPAIKAVLEGQQLALEFAPPPTPSEARFEAVLAEYIDLVAAKRRALR